jgi:CubicO group peptidase (beta-lactamase class C family)
VHEQNLRARALRRWLCEACGLIYDEARGDPDGGLAPGTRFEYCTADSQVLVWVRERATSMPYDQALGMLWRVLGCDSDAVSAALTLQPRQSGGHRGVLPTRRVCT